MNLTFRLYHLLVIDMKSQFWSKTNFSVSIILSAGYIALIYIAIDYFLNHYSRTNGSLKKPDAFVILLGLILTTLPTLYWWVMSRSFERWYHSTTLTKEQKDFERKWIDMNRDFARSFWATIVIIFGALLLKA